MKITSNIPALQAHYNMNKANAKVAASTKRLSSGYKISGVNDDPAGAAISTKMKAQLHGLQNSNRNSVDGISLVQTAEGALNEVHAMIQRIRELSVQASSETNAPDDVDKIEIEIQQLVDQIDKISSDTDFNSMKLFNGALSRLTEMTGGGVPCRAAALYLSPTVPPGNYGVTVDSPGIRATVTSSYTLGADGYISINGVGIHISAADTDADVKNRLAETADRLGIELEFTGGTNFTLTHKVAGSKNGIVLSGTAVAAASDYGTDAVVSGISGFTSAAVVAVDGNRITITDKDRREVVIDITRPDSAGFVTPQTFNLAVSGHGSLKLQTGANEDMRTELAIPKVSSETLGLRIMDSFDHNSYVNLLSVRTTAAAQNSIELCDAAIARVSETRAYLGAFANRMESNISSLENSQVSLETSLSRVIDTDMAAEMTAYTMQSIIVQAGIAVLAQANMRPQQLLQLFQ